MEAVLLFVVNTFISILVENTTKKGLKARKKRVQKRTYKKLIKEIDFELLKTYGNEQFYNELSRLICLNSILEHIFSHCYDRSSSVFKTNNAFANYITGLHNLEGIEKSNMLDAVKYIFDRMFFILNQPEYDDSRKIFNQIIEAKGEILEGQDTAKHEIKKDIESLRETITKPRKYNTFADGTYSNIKKLVDNYDIENALKEIAQALEHKDDLSIEQNEKLYFQRARIYINTRQYQWLDKIKRDIRGINSESKYICEIDYYIACHDKNIEQFNIVINRFEELEYTNIQMIEKRLNFYLNMGEIEKIKKEIIDISDIKLGLENNCVVQFNYGYLCLIEGDAEKAKHHFDIAYRIKQSLAYKYNSIVCDYYIWSKGVSGKVNPIESKEKAKKIVDDFELLKQFSEFFYGTDLINHWSIFMTLLTYISPTGALKRFSDIPTEIQNNNLIAGIKARALNMNNEFPETEKILEPIWNVNIENTSNLFFAYLNLDKPEKVIEKFNMMEFAERRNPYILSLYLTARCKFEGYESVKDEIESAIDNFDSDLVFLIEMLEIFLENNDDTLTSNILGKLKLLEMSIYELNIVSRKLYRHEKYKTCLEFVEQVNQIDEELFSLYYSAYKKTTDTSDDLRKKYYSKIKDLYLKKYRFKSLLLEKALVEIELALPNKAIGTLKEYKSVYSADESYAYYYIIAKFKAGDSTYVADEINILLSSGQSEHLQVVARMKAIQGLWDEAKSLARKSLYISSNDLRDDILANYSLFFFSNMDKEQHKYDFEKITEDSIIYLSSSERNRKVAIHSDESIVNHQGEMIFGCENYTANSTVGLLLVSIGKKGEFVTLNGTNYKVESIQNIFSYLNGYCLGMTKISIEGYFEIFKSDTPEGLAEQIRTILKLRKEQQQELMDAYNFKSGIGIPLSFISGTSVNEYYKTIMTFLNIKNQHFFTGEMNVFEDRQYVLSLSSIIILNHLKLLDKLLVIKDKITIAKQTEDEIKRALKEANKWAQLEHGHIAIDEENRIKSFMYDEKDKQAEVNFWAEALSVIADLNVRDVAIEDNEIIEIIESHLMQSDIASIEICMKDNKILISDDFFIRKLCNGVYKSGETNNVIGLIANEGILINKEYLDLILELSEKKYLSCIDSVTFIMILDMILQIEVEEQKIEYYKNLKKIISNILDSTSRAFYQNMIQDTFQLGLESGISIYTLYDLFYEPLGLKTREELISDTLKSMFQVEDIE